MEPFDDEWAVVAVAVMEPSQLSDVVPGAPYVAWVYELPAAVAAGAVVEPAVMVAAAVLPTAVPAVAVAAAVLAVGGDVAVSFAAAVVAVVAEEQSVVANVLSLEYVAVVAASFAARSAFAAGQR